MCALEAPRSVGGEACGGEARAHSAPASHTPASRTRMAGNLRQMRSKEAPRELSRVREAITACSAARTRASRAVGGEGKAPPLGGP